MKRNRLLSWLLTLSVVMGLAVPAVAAQLPADTALEQVTQAVKDALDLDTGGYDTFYGDRYEGELSATWDLYWSGTDGSLSITALDDGTIVNYRLIQDDVVTNRTDFPTFPQGNAETAAQTARSFLNRVLREKERVELTAPRGLDTLGSDSFHFSGEILLNDLPSPLTYSVTIRASDNRVTSFHRTAPENLFLGDIPNHQTTISLQQAAETLTDTLSLKLEYVLAEDEATAATLRYLPEDTDLYYVDAVSGESLNMSELGGVGSLGGSADSGDDTTSDTGDNGLTAAEQEGISKLEGVLPSDKLDRHLRSETAYGLADYTLSSAAYQLIEAEEDGGKEQVLCTLSYATSAEETYRTRTITVDARTSDVEQIYSYAPRLEEGETAAMTETQAQARAETFLAAFCEGRWEHLTLYSSENNTENRWPYYTFTYVQEANGIPFPENFYEIAVSSTDGSVYRLNYRYQDGITFSSPENIVGMDAAHSTWADTYETVLAYRLVPRPLNSADEKEERLMALGFTQYYGLRLTYALERAQVCLGIDAASGEPVWGETGEQQAIAYTDMEGTWAEADVEKLATYGIGYDGKRFRPQKSLTQWDLVALLASLNGYRIDPEHAEPETVDAAYSSAYRMGALQRKDRDEDRLISREELVRCLLDCAGYGPAAMLEGIYTCNFSDRSTIPADSLGYAAIAQALGMVKGCYDGTRTATRGELAAMLCRLLER